MRIIYLVLLFLFSFTTVDAQLSSIQQLKEADKTDLSLYFYPSTLRMMNIDQDTAFNKLIKGIQKLSFHKLTPDSFDVVSFQALKESIQEQEKFEDYITMEGGSMVGSGFQVIGNEKGDKWVGMAFINQQGYLISLKGTINWLQAPKVYRTILEKGEDSESGFGILMNYLQVNEQRQKARRERQKNRATEVPDSTKQESFQITIEG